MRAGSSAGYAADCSGARAVPHAARDPISCGLYCTAVFVKTDDVLLSLLQFKVSPISASVGVSSRGSVLVPRRSCPLANEPQVGQFDDPPRDGIEVDRVRVHGRVKDCSSSQRSPRSIAVMPMPSTRIVDGTHLDPSAFSKSERLIALSPGVTSRRILCAPAGVPLLGPLMISP
jgi:hypothetical protein